jgi:hypothetical protein
LTALFFLKVFQQLADLSERLNDTNLVVDGHDRDESSRWLDRGFEGVEGDLAVGKDREIGDLETLLAERAAGVENAFVLLCICR